MHFDLKERIFKEEAVQPDKVAFAAPDMDLTWKELKELSDQICTAFSKYIPANFPVFLKGNKEAFFLASVLSCYRLHLPFIPIDPTLPEKRIQKMMLQPGGCLLVDCQKTFSPSELSAKLQDISYQHDISFVPEHCSYILFTSGSSGEPKGVMISEENILAFTNWFIDNFNVNKETVFISLAAFSFDIALADFFGCLQLGATAICKPDNIHEERDLLLERVLQHKGSYWNSTPSLITKYLADRNFNAGTLPSVNQFVLSGEELSVRLVKELKQRFPTARIVNAYGPTETCIYASYAEITADMLYNSVLPISRVNNSTLELKGNEIIITGKRVGIGYLNDPVLTSEKFENTPCRYFKTGDRGYYKNGFIYFAGRKDDQVKFNGHRIELGEIRYALEKLSFIEKAECLPIKVAGRVKRLIAFIKVRESDIHAEEIKEMIRGELPAYMIPSEIKVISEFPLTLSSKTDRNKLLQLYLNE
jgi:D-alanine--poly(phosphoribitol) ligase subunit 1